MGPYICKSSVKAGLLSCWKEEREGQMMGRMESAGKSLSSKAAAAG